MRSKILLPHRFQKIGWLLFVPFSVLLLLTSYAEFEFGWLTIPVLESESTLSQIFDKKNFTLELELIGVFISLFFIAFSKEKEEDEFIQKLRLDSLLVAFYTYTFILIIGTLVFYGLVYFEFMGYNMFTIQLIFIGRFRWVLHSQKKSLLAL